LWSNFATRTFVGRILITIVRLNGLFMSRFGASHGSVQARKKPGY
jgi:hypothetical protein